MSVMKNYTLILALFIGLFPASFALATGPNDNGFSALPEVATFAASSVTTSSATLEGSVNVWGDAGQFWFEYGKDQNNFSAQSATQKTYSSASATESLTLTDLSPNTTYYFRIVAENDHGQVKGAVKSFTTLAVKIAPVVSSSTTSNTSSSSSSSTTSSATPSKGSSTSSTKGASSQTASVANSGLNNNGFLPSTFGGWLLILILIAAIFVIARYIYVTREREREEEMARNAAMRTA